MKKMIFSLIPLICSAGSFAQMKVVVIPHRHVMARVIVAPRVVVAPPVYVVPPVHVLSPVHVLPPIYMAPPVYMPPPVYIAPPVYGLGFSFGFPLFGRPYPHPHGSAVKLNEQISAIKSEYKFQIKAVRKDKTLSKEERKENILQLKSERESAIALAEKNFYQRRTKAPNSQPENNNQYHPQDGSSSESIYSQRS